jgi:hypothetical protein
MTEKRPRTVSEHRYPGADREEPSAMETVQNHQPPAAGPASRERFGSLTPEQRTWLLGYLWRQIGPDVLAHALAVMDEKLKP